MHGKRFGILSWQWFLLCSVKERLISSHWKRKRKIVWISPTPWALWIIRKLYHPALFFTPQESEIFITHRDFQNRYIFFYLAKGLLILDCLNRSLKGLLINHRGDVDILLFPLSNVCQVMYACNSIEYRQKINTKLPCLYSPTLYFADFCISVFQNGQCKVSNLLKDFKFDFIYSFSFPLDSPSLEKGMWFMHRVLAITTVSNSRKTVFL